MQAVFDHLIAIIVGTVVLVLALSMTLSAQESGVAATQLYAAREQTLSFLDVVQQDLANVGAAVSPGLPVIVAWEEGEPTPAFEFRGAVAPAASAAVERVRYEVVPVGTATVTVGGTEQTLPTYRVDRLVWDGTDYVLGGASPATLTTFEVRLLRDGIPLTETDDLETADEVLLRVAAVSVLGDDGVVGLTQWESRYALTNLTF
jgi:hypothetical protein